MTENELSKIVLNLGLKVHKALGAGLLINFNTVLFKNGIRRIANNL